MASTAAARVITANLISEQTPPFGGPHVIGFELLTTYMLPFQAIAFLLLVAMIGAVVLTHKQASPARARRDVRRKVSRPITAVIAAQTGRDVLNTQTSEPTSSGD